MGKKFFSKSTLGFYDDQIHVQRPDDAVEISDEKHSEIMTAQSEGKAIAADQDGHPIAVDRDPPSPEAVIKMQINALERQQTARRLREAVAGKDNGWLADLEAQIEALRVQL